MWLNGEYWLYYDGDTEVVYEKMKNEVTKKMGEIKILIVDDNQANLIALEAVLKSLNYHLIFASSGEDALRYLMKDDFAMILLDVQMPGMDGFETARFIRAREKNKNIPIIFITAICKSEENIVQGYNLGAIDYLFKPFHPETLKLKVEAFVKIHLQSQQTMLQNIFLQQLGRKLRKTSQKLTNILESITDVFFTLNHQWEFIFVNKEAEKFWQKSKGELIGRNIWELFPALLPEHYSFLQRQRPERKLRILSTFILIFCMKCMFIRLTKVYLLIIMIFLNEGCSKRK